MQPEGSLIYVDFVPKDFNTILVKCNPTENMTFYIDSTNGSDDTGNGTEDNPYKTAGYVINNVLPSVINHTIEIIVIGDFKERLTIFNKDVRAGSITIKAKNAFYGTCQAETTAGRITGNFENCEVGAEVYVFKNDLSDYERTTVTAVAADNSYIDTGSSKTFDTSWKYVVVQQKAETTDSGDTVFSIIDTNNIYIYGFYFYKNPAFSIHNAERISLYGCIIDDTITGGYSRSLCNFYNADIDIQRFYIDNDHSNCTGVYCREHSTIFIRDTILLNHNKAIKIEEQTTLDCI